MLSKALLLFACMLIGLINWKLGEIDASRSRQSDGLAVRNVRHTVLASDGPFCPKVTAYYQGTLKNKQNPDLRYITQFQVRLNADQSTQRIYVVFDQWNDTLLSRGPFSFNFIYNNKNFQGDKIGTLYSGPFARKESDFTLTLDHETSQTWDNSINILYFHTFNNSFQLENSIGKCTDNPPMFHNDYAPDSNLYKACVCCDNYNPHPALGCPKSPWA